jgi:hypothetical protein
MDNEITFYETSDIISCEKCNNPHKCKRCIKNSHICIQCGTLFYVCDICENIQNSLADLKRHQQESNICRKAKFLTATSVQDQLQKFGKESLQRRYSQIILGKQ